MVKCPRCGNDVETPVKIWPIPSRKPLKANEKPKMTGIFDCHSCKARFRAAVETETITEETASIKNMVGRIRIIRGELMQTLMSLREKIRTLEIERANLMTEIQNLRKVAESRVNALESEVGMLREEARSMRHLLGYTGEEKLEVE